MVIMQDSNDKFKIAVSDPTQKLTELNLTFNGKYISEELDDCIESISSDGKTTLKCNMTGSTGRSMECVYQK